MSFHEVKSAIVETVTGIFGDSQERKVLDQSFKYMLIAGVAVGSLFLAYTGRNWYKDYLDRVSQRDLAALFELVDQVEGPSLEGVGASSWQEVLNSAKAGYGKHSGTAMAPYFKVVESEAHLKLNQHDEAIGAMEEAVKRGSKVSPVVGMISLRHALLMIDSSDDAIKEKGVKRLTELAADKNNQHRDSALYFLGRYYWTLDERDAARDMWYDLVENYYQEDVGFGSPWAREAAIMLRHML